jgi:hypothetical protein
MKTIFSCLIAEGLAILLVLANHNAAVGLIVLLFLIAVSVFLVVKICRGRK